MRSYVVSPFSFFSLRGSTHPLYQEYVLLSWQNSLRLGIILHLLKNMLYVSLLVSFPLPGTVRDNFLFAVGGGVVLKGLRGSTLPFA